MPASSAFRNENIVMLRPSQAERSADGGTDIQRPTLSCAADQVEKILVANKFFFRNGGSEAVMFDEMDWMKGRGIDVMEFSMRDSRNRPSKYEILLRFREELQGGVEKQQNKSRDLLRSVSGSRK